MSQWLKWIDGRQESGYSKLALFPLGLSKFLNADAYLLKLPLACSVPKHKDPVEPGYNHHRLNTVIWGFGQGRMFVLGPVKRWWRTDYFRPDLYEHGMQPINGTMYILSFGWKVKAK